MQSSEKWLTRISSQLDMFCPYIVSVHVRLLI